MRAIIDLGTNTFHLLIAEVVSGCLKEIAKVQVAVKIGEGGINSGVISNAAFNRGMSALKEFRQLLDTYGVQEVTAFGTSAIRDAANGQLFIKKALEDYRIHIEAISGDKEAELIYLGISNSFHLPDEPVLVMDIGGGSVEFIIGKKSDILWKQSFRLGAARLIERYHRHEPILPNEMTMLKSYLHEMLEPLHQAVALYKPQVLVGSAGSFETLHDVLAIHFRKTPEIITPNASLVHIADFDLFHDLMIHSGKEERENAGGMVQFRVEMIVVSAIMIKYVLDTYGIKKLISSSYSLKEGMLFHT